MNQIDLKGRVAVVTGGAQGIGFATTQRLLQSGALDREEADLTDPATDETAVKPAKGLPRA